MNKVGIIGIGAMGRAMVENLHNHGVLLSVYNRTAKKLAGLSELGVSIESEPADVVNNADCTLICVSDDAATRRIIFDPSMTNDMMAPVCWVPAGHCAHRSDRRQAYRGLFATGTIH